MHVVGLIFQLHGHYACVTIENGKYVMASVTIALLSLGWSIFHKIYHKSATDAHSEDAIKWYDHTCTKPPRVREMRCNMSRSHMRSIVVSVSWGFFKMQFQYWNDISSALIKVLCEWVMLMHILRICKGASCMYSHTVECIFRKCLGVRFAINFLKIFNQEGIFTSCPSQKRIWDKRNIWTRFQEGLCP